MTTDVWFARDKNGQVYMYFEKPVKVDKGWWTIEGGVTADNMVEINKSFVRIMKSKKLSWECDEPVKGTLEIESDEEA